MVSRFAGGNAANRQRAYSSVVSRVIVDNKDDDRSRPLLYIVSRDRTLARMP